MTWLKTSMQRLVGRVNDRINPGAATASSYVNFMADTIMAFGADPQRPAWEQSGTRINRYVVSRRIYKWQPVIKAAVNIRAGSATIPNKSGESPLVLYAVNENVMKILTDTAYRLGLDTRLFSIQKGILKYGDVGYEVRWNKKFISSMVPVLKPDMIYSKVYDRSGLLKGYQILESTEHGGKKHFIPWWEFVHFSDDPEAPFGEGVLAELDHAETSYRFARASMTIARIFRGEDRNAYPVDFSSARSDKERLMKMKLAQAMNKSRRIANKDGHLLSNNFPLESQADIYVGIRPDLKQFEARINKVAGQDGLDAIEDIRYLRDEMLAPIGVPKRYVMADKDITAKASIDRQDVQMIRLCILDQKGPIRGIRELFDRQLAALGYNPADPKNAYVAGIVDLSLDDEKLFWEIEKIKVGVLAEMRKEGIFDDVELLRRIFKYSDSDLKRLLVPGSANKRTASQTEQVGRALSSIVKSSKGLRVLEAEFGIKGTAEEDVSDE